MMLARHHIRRPFRAALALFLAAAAGPASAGLLECVAAEVNGEIVTLSDVVRQKKAVLEEIYAQKLSDGETQKHIEEAKTRLLSDLIEERLLLQKARDSGVAVGKEEVDSIVKRIMESNGIASEADLERRLGAEKMTVAALRANIERRTTLEKVKQYEVASKIVVTDEEARRYYDAHRDEFRDPERVRLREIVLLVEKRDPEQVKKEISELVNLARNGADFAELATLFSQAPTAEHGGDLGLVRVSDLSPDIRDSAAKLSIGELSDPIHTRFGFHVLKLMERKDVTYRSFEEVRDRISEKVQMTRYEERVDSYVAGLRKSAFIKVHDECVAKGM